jgi:1,4-alpha-glucan branching enzyme
LHGAGIGVILDWVPSHFPSDEHGLGYFDGTRLYEHADPRKGYQPDWQSLVFNYGRGEVRSFLISSAIFWLDTFHADGLRVDAVASMLYLDFSRRAGEWVPNIYGGRENLDAVAFLRRANDEIHRLHPEAEIAAEESTDWPGVTRPTFVGGLGFDLKWDLGWMNDTLEYMELDPIHRKFHHELLTFRRMYAYKERFLLPLSHDEVVHLKGSLLTKMPGDEWQKFANLRLLFGWMWAQPGKKLLFMGGEIGQWREWNQDASLDWHLLEMSRHEGLRTWVRDLNRVMREERSLHEQDWDPAGFDWIDCHDADHSVVALLRYPKDAGKEAVAVALNFTPVPRVGYLLGVPWGGTWKEIANSDAIEYGGSGMGNMGEVEAKVGGVHGRPFHLRLTLPPLAAVFLKGVAPEDETAEETKAEDRESESEIGNRELGIEGSDQAVEE